MKTGTDRPGRARWGRVGALFVAVVVLATGCYFSEADEMQRTSPDRRPWFCNGVGNGSPPGAPGHAHPRYEGLTKGPLNWDDCILLSHQLDEAETAVKDWKTRSAGEAAGFTSVAPYTAGLGTHHARGYGFLTNSVFDHKVPQLLIYGGNAGDAPLVGVVYSWAGTLAPPPAFAGGNDWWHLHTRLCYSSSDGAILGGAQDIPDDVCTSLGGYTQYLPGSGVWLLHVWVVGPWQYRPDIFSAGHSCLLPGGLAPDGDPCWEAARRDPALGPPVA